MRRYGTALVSRFRSQRRQFEVTYSDGSIETYPNAGYLLVQIAEDLG